MVKEYTEAIDHEQLSLLVQAENWQEALEELAQPLHRWLYSQQDFQALASRSPIDRVILSFDYVQSQVGQGGFIQLIQNGYTSLLATIIENLQILRIETGMIQILDDVLRVYVLNEKELTRETTVEEFGRMYQEYEEFAILEQQFNKLLSGFQQLVVNYVIE